MELHNKQKEFINSNKRFKVLNWGRRTGKTTAVGYEIFEKLWNNTGLVSYYAPTREDARDIAWDIFKEILEPIIVKTNEQLLEIEVRNGNKEISKLRLSGWESVKNRDKGRGVENIHVVLDEVAFYPMFLEKFEKVIEPTVLTSKGSITFTSTPNGFNHFYDLANTAQSIDDYYYSHATSYDNPFNDPVELDKLRTTKNPDSFAQEYLADFRKVQGLVYAEFDRNKHVKSELPDKSNVAEILLGVDFGYTNPTAIVEIWKLRNGQYYMVSEYYERERLNSDVIEYVKTYGANAVYPDPAEPDRIEEMRRAGINCRDVKKDVVKGIDSVRDLLRNGQFFIHDSCVSTLFEIENYRYKEKRLTDTSPEEPVKENDHLMDAMRYVLFMQQPTNVFDRAKHANVMQIRLKLLVNHNK